MPVEYPANSNYLRIASTRRSLACFVVRFGSSARAEASPQEQSARYLAYDEARETIAKYADSGLPGSTIASQQEWDAWIRSQDADVRSRIDRGVEDSISNLVLFGTSFTKLPRLGSPEFAVAVSGELSPAARMRVHDL